MSRFRFALAGPDDDAALRQRMAEDWMPGPVTISFRREPNFFAGASLQGQSVQTIACYDEGIGKLIGLGTRASSHGYVNGEVRRFGYLADLRCESSYRGGLLLARGYQVLRELHLQDEVPFYTTVIYAGNERARSVLCGGRAGLPQYRPFGRLRTPAIRLEREKALLCLAAVDIERAAPQDLPAILQYLNVRLASRQFGPAYTLLDFESGRLCGLHASDFLLARRHGRIVGAIALWDQSALRQTHVERYTGMLRVARPLLNALATCSGARPLPPPGARIPYIYWSCFAVDDDDVAIGRAVIRAAYVASLRGPWHYAILGLHERDPLAPLLNEYASIDASGNMFVVHYAQGAATVDGLDARPPYLEAGCL